MIWSQSFPGLVMAGHGVTEGSFEVHHRTGISLRIGGLADLCRRCGPEGGVYHPWRPALMEPGERRLSRADAMARIRTLVAPMDRAFNQFEVHEHRDGGSIGTASPHHSRIEHGHTDGSEPHKHAEAGSASFTMDKDENARFHLGGGGKRAWKAKPTGPELAYVELTDDERRFAVVITAGYINPAAINDFHDQYFNAGNVGRSPKPSAEWSRAAHRESLEQYVEAIRLQALGDDDVVVVGSGAIPMAAARMVVTFRLTPVYSIEGWTPTFGGLP